MHSITASTFITTVFPSTLLAADEAVVVCHPAHFTRADGERVDYFKNYDAYNRGVLKKIDRQAGAVSWYFCVSTAHRLPGERLRRTKGSLAHAWVLVLDDIGTKADPPPVTPSYILETSPGNYQYGYLLQPLAVGGSGGGGGGGGGGARYYDACLAGLASAGFNDPGCRSASRIMRLPGSLHAVAGFTAQIVHWQPGACWDLEPLMTAFGVAPDYTRVRGGGARAGRHSRLVDVTDPLLDFLADKGMLLGHNDQWQFIMCPWRAAHTDGAQGSSSSAYSPLDYGMAGRQFRCLHGHCAGRGLADLLGWAAARGGPDFMSTSTARPGPFTDLHNTDTNSSGDFFNDKNNQYTNKPHDRGATAGPAICQRTRLAAALVAAADRS